MGGVPPSVTAAATAPAASSATVTVGEAPVKAVPEKLQDLARPVVLPGTVAGETADGLTRVRTQAGEVVIKSPLPLLTDRPVTLQIAAGQPPSLATILAPPTSLGTAPAQTPAPAPAVLVQIGGPPVPAPAMPSPSGPAVAGPSSAPSPTPAAPLLLPGPAGTVSLPASPIQPGALLPAVVLAVARNAQAPVGRDAAGVPLPATAPQPSTAASPPLPAQTAPTAAAPQAGAPASPAADGLAAAALNAFVGPDGAEDNPVELGGDAAHPGGGSGQPPAAKGDAARPPLPPVLRPGGTVAVKILMLEPPTAQAPAFDGGDTPVPEPPDGLPPGSVVVRGTVAGTTGEGRPIIATRLGMLALGQGEALPKGTVLTVALSDPGTALEGIAGREVFLASSREWPALREALVTLAGIDRALAQSLMNTVVPQPNRRMAAAASFFLAAVRGGDARAWLGDDATETLRRHGRGDLLAALDREFRAMQQQAADPLPGGWHGFTLPVFDGTMLQPVRVHIHPIHGDEDEKGAAKDRPPKGSRFVIDVDLSRLGPLQLDGMVRERRFDLILRSRTPLDAGLRDELGGVFSTSVGAVGFAGSLLFQTDSRQWVTLTPGGGPRMGVTA
ncbi:hypothetical protein M2352_002359 [Azospirillum fermentarium]|uniref:hypothetical protein n=1 Tax=Azospirillum fermentarium TaxID=1233114 RepID=UPI0022273FC4|nr:hypothetical protein [Azospirillum fermentarium]MCW2246768.1 hypothetical protein [Azospirillum fermentarium]